MNIKLPEHVLWLIRTLESNGAEAWIVGGCVRDSILGREPKDWDICTDAKPDRILSIFAGQHVLETGLKHGTVSVVLEHVPYEITTYRVDGGYTDHRHPDDVHFVSEIREDLSRRDFTMNAMAWHPERGLMDPFGGERDLRNACIRCVGDAGKRFEEDALRILRALRFAATFGFRLSQDTSMACMAKKGTLAYVAAERIYTELGKLILGPACQNVLVQYADILAEVIPELRSILDENPKETYLHICTALSMSPANLPFRLAILLHECRPEKTADLDKTDIKNAASHETAALCRNVLMRLKADRTTLDYVTSLVTWKSLPVPYTRSQMLQCMHRIGPDIMQSVLLMQRLDALADPMQCHDSLICRIDQATALLNDLLEQDACYTLKQLKIDGEDLKQAGFTSGRELGAALEHLLALVMDGQLPNERNALLERASQILHS